MAMQFGCGGAVSCVAVVLGLIDLRSALRPSVEPFGRVKLHWLVGLEALAPATFGVISSWAVALTGLTAL